MRADNASMYAGKSTLPDSSQASTSTTQRACGTPAACRASIAVKDAKAA